MTILNWILNCNQLFRSLPHFGWIKQGWNDFSRCDIPYFNLSNGLWSYWTRCFVGTDKCKRFISFSERLWSACDSFFLNETFNVFSRINVSHLYWFIKRFSFGLIFFVDVVVFSLSIYIGNSSNNSVTTIFLFQIDACVYSCNCNIQQQLKQWRKCRNILHLRCT